MSVKIRLQRQGAKKNPLYFVVATQESGKRDGNFLEKLGNYNPKAKNPAEKMTVNHEAVQAWLAKGAQCTRTVGQLLKLTAK